MFLETFLLLFGGGDTGEETGGGGCFGGGDTGKSGGGGLRAPSFTVWLQSTNIGFFLYYLPSKFLSLYRPLPRGIKIEPQLSSCASNNFIL